MTTGSTLGDDIFSDAGLTCDSFLGGAVRAWQPQKGYRAGIDPVLLAAAVPAQAGQTVLELGCGAGVASLCLAHRVRGLSLTGVELQPAYAELARRNALENACDLAVITADLSDLPAYLRQQSFDHVIANPPYYLRSQGTASPEPGRDKALAGDTPLTDWMEVSAKRLKPKGFLTLIQDMRRLPAVLSAIPSQLGSLQIMPLSARAQRPPHLFLLRARKGGRGNFSQHFPSVMHDGERHQDDGPDYSSEFEAVLRHGGALEL